MRSVLSKTSDCPPQYDGLLRQSTDKIRASSAGSTGCKNRPTDRTGHNPVRQPPGTVRDGVVFVASYLALSRKLGLTVYAKLRCIATVGTER